MLDKALPYGEMLMIYEIQYTEWTKNARPNLQKVNLHQNQSKKLCMNTGFLKHDLWLTASWRLKKTLKVPPLNFNAGCCKLVQRFPNMVENSRCRTNHLKSILYSLLQVLDFRCLQRYKCKGLKLGERAGHAAGPPPSYPLFWKHVVPEFSNCKKKIWYSNITHEPINES
jgi:hypothetical protein